MNTIKEFITTPEVINIIKTIKQIQKRMLDPDLVDQDFAIVYNTLCNEFSDFVENNTQIFMTIVKGKDIRTVCEVLYFRDKVLKGEMTESELSDLLAKRFIPEKLRTQ